MSMNLRVLFGGRGDCSGVRRGAVGVPGSASCQAKACHFGSATSNTSFNVYSLFPSTPHSFPTDFIFMLSSTMARTSSIDDKSFCLPVINHERHSRKLKTGVLSWPSRRPYLIAVGVILSTFLLIGVVHSPKIWHETLHPSPMHAGGPRDHHPRPPTVSDSDWEDAFADAVVHAPDPSMSEGSPVDVDPEETLWTARAEAVKAEFLYAYHAYEKHAMPSDELQPLSSTPINKCVAGLC